MGLFDGLEKFGMKRNIEDVVGDDLFLSSKEKAQQLSASEDEPEDDGMTEEERRLAIEKSHLIRKKIYCKCCDQVFTSLSPKSGNLKRLESDIDLRPRFENFDTLKYGTYHCLRCGYTSTTKSFAKLNTRSRIAVLKKICMNYKSEEDAEKKETLTYDEAIAYHKLALYTEIVKDGDISDKAYICLLLGWLYRGKREELEQRAQADAKEIKACIAEENECLQQAFDGFYKAFSKESAPYAGMDDLTTQYLLAALAYLLGRYDVSAKLLGNIIVSRSATNRMKDKAHLLKDKVVEKMGKQKE